MAYTMTTRTTKDAATPWFNQANPESALRYTNFTKNYPGVLEATVTSFSDTEWNSVIVFENKEAYQAFYAACLTNADWVARKAYSNANNIVAKFTFA